MAELLETRTPRGLLLTDHSTNVVGTVVYSPNRYPYVWQFQSFDSCYSGPVRRNLKAAEYDGFAHYHEHYADNN